MPRFMPSPAAIRHQQRKSQPQPDNNLHAPRPYNPEDDAPFLTPPAPEEAKETSFTISLC